MADALRARGALLRQGGGGAAEQQQQKEAGKVQQQQQAAADAAALATVVRKAIASQLQGRTERAAELYGEAAAKAFALARRGGRARPVPLGLALSKLTPPPSHPPNATPTAFAPPATSTAPKAWWAPTCASARRSSLRSWASPPAICARGAAVLRAAAATGRAPQRRSALAARGAPPSPRSARCSAAWTRARCCRRAAPPPPLAVAAGRRRGRTRRAAWPTRRGWVAHKARLGGQPPPGAALLRAVADAAAYALALDAAAMLLDLMSLPDIARPASAAAAAALAFALAAAGLVTASEGAVLVRAAPEEGLVGVAQGLTRPGRGPLPPALGAVAAWLDDPRMVALVTARRAQLPPQPQQRLAAFAAGRDPRLCALPSCFNAEAGDAVFRVCPRCAGRAAYCCAEHQHADWKAHKKGCVQPQTTGPQPSG